MEDVDMHDPSEGGARGKLELDSQKFRLMFAVLGATTDTEIAAMAGYSPRTIRRACGGQMGEFFIVNTIHTLQQHSEQLGRYGLTPGLDDLFRVVGARPVESQAA